MTTFSLPSFHFKIVKLFNARFSYKQFKESNTNEIDI